MTRHLLGLVLILFGSQAFAVQINGDDVVKTGFTALHRNLMGSGQSTGLSGYEALVGLGLWQKFYAEWPAALNPFPSPEERTREFIRNAEMLVQNGLTLAQLCRLAYPLHHAAWTPERMVQLALGQFGNQLNEFRTAIDAWVRAVEWINLGDPSCGPDLSVKR